VARGPDRLLLLVDRNFLAAGIVVPLVPTDEPKLDDAGHLRKRREGRSRSCRRPTWRGHRHETIRSRTVAGAEQQLWGILLAYNLIRLEMVIET
jgi:hypothetical protein